MRLLILLKSVDGGTGTYVEGLLNLKKKYPPRMMETEVLVLEIPKFRAKKVDNFKYFPRRKPISGKYKLTPKTAWGIYSEILWFAKAVEFFNPDIVISSDSHSILISEAAKLVKNFKYRTINVIHNNLREVLKYRLKWLYRPFFKWLFGIFLRRSNMVVTVSQELSKDVYIDYKLKRVPEAIPPLLPKTSKTISRKNKNSKVKIIVSVARLDKQKDHETLLKAFADVNRKIDNLRLWIIGDGPLKKELQSLSKKLKVTDRVKFLGWKQDPSIALEKADIFVHASKWEGFGLSIVEAMQKSLPVIATDSKYGPSEIIGKNKYGILVPVGGYKSMSKAIFDICSDKKKYKHFSQMAEKRADDFSPEKMLLKYKNLIDNLN